VKPQPTEQVYQIYNSANFAPRDPLDQDAPDFAREIHCPYGAPGDQLWVRETWQINHIDYDRGPAPKSRPLDAELLYRADGEFRDQFEIDEGGSGWRPSIFMPRWASRISLEITGVRVERVQDISDADAKAEGVPEGAFDTGLTYVPSYVESFMNLWDAINAARAPWDSNPWVWVVEFRRIV